MKFLSIEYIKKHLRLDFDCEDSLLELYADSAEQKIANDLNRGKTVSDMVTSLTEEYGEIPANIYHAGLILVDASYQHRSVVSPQNLYIVPYAYDSHVKPYMKL